MDRAHDNRTKAPKSDAVQPVRAEDTGNRVADAAGETLPATVRQAMEPRFGRDFSEVRIHADARAAAAARGAGARAYTMGTDVVFGAGEYRPHTESGRRLIAHELAHVVQQTRGGGSPDAEQRAERAAADVARGASVGELGGAPVSLQAQKLPASQPQGPTSQPNPGGQPQAKTSGGKTTISKTLDKFALNSSALTADHTKDIGALAASIAGNPDVVAGGRVTIAISGHTDTSGDDKYNEGLGQDRADSAKSALDTELAKQKLKPGTVAGVTSGSFGESKLRIPTKNNVQEPRNRRVEIVVTIEQAPAPVQAPPPTTTPVPGPPTIPKVPIDLGAKPKDEGPRPPFRDPNDTELWKKMQRIDDYLREHPAPPPKSPLDVVTDKIVEGLEPLIKKLPEKYRAKARDAVRSGIEKGTEKACEAAIDAAGIAGPEAEALKTACKAALKTERK